MAFRIKGSHIIAIAMAAGLGYWMFTGEYQIGGKTGTSEQSPPIAQREAERGLELFKIRYVPLQSEQRSERILIRGRTQADAIVTVRAETACVLEHARIMSLPMDIVPPDVDFLERRQPAHFASECTSITSNVDCRSYFQIGRGLPLR